jgi:hypothetical protein
MTSVTKYCGTGATQAQSPWWDNDAWVNAGNITADDSSYATILLGPTKEAYLLVAKNFGFAIDSDQKIDGIKVEVKTLVSDASSDIGCSLATLTKDGSSWVGDRHDASFVWSSPEAYWSYGGDGNKWGTTWTPAEINSATFGFLISCYDNSYASTAKVNAIRVTIYHSYAINQYSESCAVSVGCVVTASRAIDMHVTSTIKMGMWIINAIALKGVIIRSAIIKYGMKVTGSAGKRAFGYVLKRYIKFASKKKTVRFIE